MDSNHCRLIAVSGKMGAGKDTIAPLLMNKMNPNGKNVHMSFADPLREEVNEIIDSNSYAEDGEGYLYKVRRVMDDAPSREILMQARRLVIQAIHNEGVITASDHTTSMRMLLQWWGTDVRRAVDPDYWVKRTMRMVMRAMGNGVSVYITDARFTNELDAIHAAGGKIIRIDVEESVRIDRILHRDGVRPTRAQLSHPSETDADGYDGFDVRINADSMGIDKVVDKVYTLLSRLS